MLGDSNRILIVTQPEYPVPPVNDGAQSIVIYNTVQHLDGSRFKTISLWNERLKNTSVDKAKFHFVKNHSLWFRVIRKIILKMKTMKYIQSARYGDLLIGIFFFLSIHKNYALVVHSTKMNWLVELKKWFPKTKIISYHHSSEDQNCSNDMLKLVTEKVDGHIFVSHFGEKEFLSKAKQVAPSKNLVTATIQNGVDLTVFKPNPESKNELRVKLGIPSDRITLLFAGRIIPRKGLHILLEAIDLLSPMECQRLQLVIAGGSDFFSNETTEYMLGINRRIEELRLKVNIIQLGYIPHSKVHELFRASDIFAFMSVEPEGSPLALMEAAACGLPVIASNIGGIAEIVKHKQTGYIVDLPLDPQHICGYVLRMMKDDDLLKNLGANAVNLSKQQFSAERMTLDFQNTISSMTKSIE